MVKSHVFLYRETSINKNRSFQKFILYLPIFWGVKLDFWDEKETWVGKINLSLRVRGGMPQKKKS
jgi:hypothetical protein